jgi:toxin-antitoxin system PIN domain toxin
VILPDVNALLYAFEANSPFHVPWRTWLDSVLDGADELALADHCCIGVIRLATNPRVTRVPASTEVASDFVAALRAADRTRTVVATDATWQTFRRFVGGDRRIRANLVPDAYLAALAVSHGCRLATADRGFARFPGLDVFDPTA